MANKKNIETNKKSNELEQKKATQKKKLRLHSHLKVNIPLFQSLIMILPSLAKHASAEGVDNYSNEANRATENSVAEKDVTDDHGKANSSAVTHQESPTSENHVGSTLSVSHAPHGSNSHLVPSHHLSTFSHPQVHYIPSISMPTISLESNGQPTHSNNTPPTTPASPVTFVSEVIKGAYGELHVDANGQYTFVLNPNSPQYILLNQNKHGTDHFVLNLSDGSKIVVQIPVTGKQDTPTISGDLAGVVTEDHKVDSHGLLHANGKIDVIDPDQNESSMKPEVLAGKYGSLSIDADGHWQYHVDNSLSNIQALTSATSLHESFVIHTQDGTPQTLDMTIGGNDDNAVVTGIDTGVVTEDVTTQIQGQLTVNDSDLGENHFQASQINGHLGTLTITKDGAWTYALDNSNPAVQRLAQGSTATDIITVHSADGTAHQVTVTITGTGDAATIGGVDTGSIIENTAGVNMSPDYAQPGIATLGNTTLYADGKLTITDPDVGESGFERQGSNGYDYHGTYGDLILLTDGTWHYHADAGHLSGIGARPTTRGTAIDQLGEGQSLTDTITVHSKDGTTHDIVITIHGSNDRPYCSSEVVLANGSEDTRQTLTTAQLLANTVDVDANDAGKLAIENLHADHGSILNNADGTFTFTPEKDYNGDVHFRYDVKDAHGGVAHTGATTNLAAVNDNPDVTPLTDSVSEGADNHHTLNLLVGATDKDGDALSVSHLEYAIDGQPQAGKIPAGITLDTDGHTLIVDATNPAFNHLANGQSQQIAITYQVEDGHGGSTQQTATLTIAGTDDKATLVSNVIQLTETQALDSEFKSYRGQLQLIDPDSGDNTQFVFSGKYLGQGFAPGYLDVWPNGSYQFKLDAGTNRHADELIGSLHAGESKEFPYEVETSDGQKLTIMVKVTGEDNQAKIAVTPYSSLNNHVYEDHTSFGNTTSQLSSGGTLHVIDPDHDQAGFIAQTITTAEGGQFNINAQGHWSYNIDNDKVQHLGAGESFQQTFTVESIDGSAKKDITVTVHGTNDAPVASAEVRLANGLEDNKIVLTPAQLLANTSDVDDNDIGKLSIENLQADHGSILINGDGTFTFTPEKDYNGAVHFSYDVKDAHGGVTHTGASTTLSAVGDAATIAGIDTGSISENTAGVDKSPDYAQPGIATLGNAPLYADGKLTITDPDVGEAGFERQGSNGYDYHGTYGDLILLTDGTWHYQADAGHRALIGGTTTTRGTAIDQLGENQSLTDTITVHSKDGTTHDIVITIHGSNDRPYCSSEVILQSGSEDTRQTLTTAQLLANTVDVDKNDAGLLSIENLHADHGSILNNADGTFTFTPEKDYNGDVHFRYDVKDAHGGVTHTGASTTLSAVDDAAVITGTGGHLLEEDNLYYGYTIKTNGQFQVVDPDGPGQSKFPDGLHHHTGTLGGTLQLYGNGNYFYHIDNSTVNHLAKGQEAKETFTIHSVDGTSHQVEFVIEGTNDAPFVHGDVTLSSGIEDTAVTLHASDLLAQAGDYDDGETAHLSVHNLSADHGTVTDNKDGTYTFKPDADYNGAVHFTYDVQDPQGATVAASASMSLAAVADTPIVNVDIADTADNVLNASESGAATISGSLDPSVASTLDRIEITDGTTTVTVDKANITVAADGTYQTTADISSLKDGTLTVTAHATSHDGTTATSTDTIIKDSVATVHDNNASMNENQPSIHGNLIADDEAGVQVTGGLGEQLGSYGKFVIHANGSYTYTPDARAQALNLNEHQQETFTFTVTDKAGNTAIETFQISLTGRNDGPVITNAVSDSQGATVEDGATRVSGQLSASDLDKGDQLSWEVVGSGSNPGTGNYGNLAVLPSTGQWVYRLDQGAHTQALADGEQKQETFTLRVTDSYGASVDQTVVITVTGTNDAPVVSSSVALVAGTEDTAVTLTEAQLLANASDVDHGETALLSVHNLSADHGTVTDNKDGTYTFKPDADYNGPVHFTYDVQDPQGSTVATSASMNLAAVDDAAVIGGADSGNVKEDVHVDSKFDISLSGHLAIQDPDGPSEELFQTISLATTPQGGTLQLYSNGNWFYDINNHAIDHLDEGQIVQDTLTVYSKDGTAHVLHFTIEGTNDIPDINAQTRYLAEDGKVLNGKMYAYDPDDHAQLTFTLGHPVDGLTMHKDGSYSFDPSNSAYQHISQNVQRTIQVPVTVTDEHGAHTTQNLSFVITGSNDGAVIAGNDRGDVSEDLNVQHHELQTQGALTSYDIDNVDNAFKDESLSTLKDGSHALGTLHMDTSGTWTYTVDNRAIQSMNSNDTKVETFVVHSVDGTSHEVVVTIHGTNDASTTPLVHTSHPAPPPPPPVQHDEPDMASQVDFTVTLSDDSNLDSTQQTHQEPDQKTSHHGVAAYLDALGIKPDVTSTTVHDQPADMDIVFAQVDQQDAVTHDQTHLDMSDALEHHDVNINHNQDDEHHHHNDVDGLADIDPNS